MDLSLLKQKLDTLQSKPQGGGQKTDYTKIFWRPSVGKQQIRIVPSAFDKKNPFKELKFYYGITNKVMISPLNFGEKDPIHLFSQKRCTHEQYQVNWCNFYGTTKAPGRLHAVPGRPQSPRGNPAMQKYEKMQKIIRNYRFLSNSLVSGIAEPPKSMVLLRFCLVLRVLRKPCPPTSLRLERKELES